MHTHLGEAFVHVDLGHSARLHLRPNKLDPGLERFQYLVVTPRLPAEATTTTTVCVEAAQGTRVGRA